MAFTPVLPGSTVYPEIRLRWAPTSQPTDSSQTYVDITDRLRGWEWGYGRNDELGRFEAGNGSVLLDNRDRRFDPSYSGELVNLVTNPSFEVNTTGWTDFSGGGTLTRITTDFVVGVACLKFDMVAVGSGVIFNGPTGLALPAGTPLTGQVWFKGTAGQTYEVQANGVNTDASPFGTTTVFVATGAWELKTASTVVPVGKTCDKIQVLVYKRAGVGANTPGADSVRIDAVQSETAATASDYIDGSIDNGRWSGTAHASTSYRGGPYYGNIKPRKMFELVAKWDAVEYPVFVAYARGFPQSYPASGFDNVVKVDLVDAFAIMQGIDMTVGFSRPDEMAGQRLFALLQGGDSVVGLRLSQVGIEGGNPDEFGEVDPTPVVAALAEVTEAGTSALDHVRLVAESAGGQLFVDKQGRVIFHRYEHRLNAASLHTFTDTASAALGYTDFAPAYDETYLANFARVTGAGGDDTAQIAEDTASQDDYHRITKTLSTLLASGSDIQQTADRIVLRYPQPEQRAPSLSVIGAGSPDDRWPVILDLEISDRVTAERFADDVDPMILIQNVEGIHHSCSPGGPWLTQIRTSPADTRTYMVSDDATLGISDSVNVAA